MDLVNKKLDWFLATYLNNRKQRVKFNKTLSSWRELLYGVPYRSALEPIFLNIYLNDLFSFLNKTDVCNFAFVWNKNFAEFLEKLERNFELDIC